MPKVSPTASTSHTSSSQHIPLTHQLTLCAQLCAASLSVGSSTELEPGSLSASDYTLDWAHSSATTKLQLPYALLHSLSRGAPSHTGAPSPLTLRTRDYQRFQLHFDSVDDAQLVWDTIKSLLAQLSPSRIDTLVALRSREQPASSTADEWQIYDLEREFGRMGVGRRSQAWRYTTINSDYEVSVPMLHRLRGSLMAR